MIELMKSRELQSAPHPEPRLSAPVKTGKLGIKSRISSCELVHHLELMQHGDTGENARKREQLTPPRMTNNQVRTEPLISQLKRSLCRRRSPEALDL